MKKLQLQAHFRLILSRYLIFKTGFKLRRLKVSENYEFEYIERGSIDEQEISLLLVHGYTSGKDAWCMMANYIPKRIHVVALDLPGHGGTTRKEKEDLSVPGIAKRVEQVFVPSFYIIFCPKVYLSENMMMSESFIFVENRRAQSKTI